MARVMARPRALRLMLLAVLVAGLLVPGAPARACSCAEMDLGSLLPDADGAFVGTFVDRSEISDQLASITFDVERVVKGEFGPRAIVRTNAYGASCGLEFLDGPRIGLLLDRASDGVWESSLCQQVQPGDLLAIGGERPPDPDVAPVSAGWTLGSQGLVGTIVAAALVLVVLVWVIRRRSSRPGSGLT
ncbi:MAG TPA: hypothetical protein VF195_12965 [Actinomycetota bacterium]